MYASADSRKLNRIATLVHDLATICKRKYEGEELEDWLDRIDVMTEAELEAELTRAEDAEEEPEEDTKPKAKPTLKREREQTGDEGEGGVKEPKVMLPVLEKRMLMRASAIEVTRRFLGEAASRLSGRLRGSINLIVSEFIKCLGEAERHGGCSGRMSWEDASAFVRQVANDRKVFHKGFTKHTQNWLSLVDDVRAHLSCDLFFRHPAQSEHMDRLVTQLNWFSE